MANSPFYTDRYDIEGVKKSSNQRNIFEDAIQSFQRGHQQVKVQTPIEQVMFTVCGDGHRFAIQNDFIKQDFAVFQIGLYSEVFIAKPFRKLGSDLMP